MASTTTARLPRRTLRRGVIIAVGLLGIGALSLIFRFNPSEHSFFPRCAFHAVTGWDCPGCGGQRALHSMLHGDWRTALHYNALLIGLLPIGFWMLVRSLWNKRSQQTIPTPFDHHLWPWVLCGLVISFGVVRNLPGFEWLRP